LFWVQSENIKIGSKAKLICFFLWQRQDRFVAGIMIQMIDGEKSIAPLAPEAIEDIKIGDWVLSDDPNTPGGIEYKQVLQTFINHTTQLVDIYINGEKITTTEGHPFWVKDVGWILAKDLNAGTHLQTSTESWLNIDKVETHTGLTTIYNFEVAGFHTYFVSDLGLLVHNTSLPGGAASRLSDLRGLYPDSAELALHSAGFKGNPVSPKSLWQKFKHPDGSVVDINWQSGRVVRTAAPKYDPSTGARINDGQRIKFDGTEIPRPTPHDLHPPEYINPTQF
jgi:Pretoxin HINT domain